MKYITIVSVLLTLASAFDMNMPNFQIHAVQGEDQDSKDTKFLGKLGGHLSIMNSLTDYLMKLFNVKDAELMSQTSRKIVFDMSDKSLWYNESLNDVYIPTFQNLQNRFNGNETGNLTLPNLKTALTEYCASTWYKLNQTMLDNLTAEFTKNEINNTVGNVSTPSGNMDETGYNNISAKVFPIVMPKVNMIDNKLGPYSFHLTLDLHGEAENYPNYDNQSNVLLMGYHNQSWTLGPNSTIDKLLNDSYIIYADPTVTQGNIIQYPTPSNFFQPTIDRPFWIGWQKVGNSKQTKVAFAYTDPRPAYDSTQRYGDPTKGAMHLTAVIGMTISLLGLII